ncbi:MarR family winged helix-turn-helix transcriptional regulator [Actinomadura kijaniata]|uniref:DNA-binding MarR family transcriptional regulator n=1 Tax=Actinomadura namibiensis TaxID=182080 RepID=A0A7W3LT58_ACTNM|nr:MarR family winged helix-turn-helix transcriptional regulator [Actinomadura namibiensis]MBA8953799.1 DNA-binding MarR family transcriptional regulator [Actinomadura namibiensis]
MEDPSTDLRAFAVELRRMNSEFNRIAHEFARAHHLHPTDVQALAAILDAPARPPGRPMTPGRLRAQLNLTSGAVSACLDRLERAGHVRRVRDSHDRRVVYLHYESGAKRLAAEFFRPLSEATRAARDRFDEDELRTVLRFVRAMNEELADLRSLGHPGSGAREP